MDEGIQLKPRRKILPIILTFGGLFLLVAFVWRVVYFMDAIHSGKVDLSSLSYTNDFTPLPVLPAVPPASVGTTSIERASAASLGSAQAPLQVVEFADFGCPYSKESSDVVRTLAQKYPNIMHISFRYFPIDSLHPNATHAAEAAECANAQGKFWQYHDILFLNQQDISDAALLQYAKEVNLDPDAFQTCLSSGRYLSLVQADVAAGTAAGVVGTPTFFFNGTPIAGSIPSDVFEKLILSFAKPS